MASTDEQLLQGGPRAFGEFYARHERAVFRYFYRRVVDAEVAADLTAECFAAALLSGHRFRADEGSPAVAWLFGIARNVLRRSAEQPAGGVAGAVTARDAAAAARRRRRSDALDRIHAGQLMEHALAYLPADQAEAVRARIVDEREYEDIARELRTSEAVVRKRVSRGLGALRRQVEDRA